MLENEVVIEQKNWEGKKKNKNTDKQKQKCQKRCNKSKK